MRSIAAVLSRILDSLSIIYDSLGAFDENQGLLCRIHP
jgi:hypothetical protein